MTITLYRGRTVIAVYESEFLPAVDHIFRIEDREWQVSRVWSTIISSERRSGTAHQTNFSADVLPYIK